MEGLRLKNVGKRFGKGASSFWAIRHVNYRFPVTGLVAIEGKSGSGKSTLLHLIAGFLSPEEGGVYLNGKKISSLHGKRERDYRREGASLVFQHYNLIEDATALYNVSLPLKIAGVGGKEAERRAGELLAKFGMGGLQEQLASSLSGGEKQRVAIARSLSLNPPLLLADEPTGALDEKNGALIMGALKEASRERLVLLVSHNHELVEKYADGILKIEKGRLSEEKAPPFSGEARRKRKERRKRRASSSWPSFFLKRNFKQNRGKDALSLLGGLIGFSSLLLSLGFYAGSEASLDKASVSSLSSLSCTISWRRSVEVEGSPLKLIERRRPEKEGALEALSPLEGFRLAEDFAYFFPESRPFAINGREQEPAFFSPVYDLSLQKAGLSLLKEGKPPEGNDFSSCLVNAPFASSFGAKVGDVISFSGDFSISYQGEGDLVDFPVRWEIRGIVEEFSFLSSPRVYYSYLGLRDSLSSLELPNISESLGFAVDPVSLSASAPGDSPLTGYGYRVFLDSFEAVEPMFEKLRLFREESEGYSLLSEVADAQEAFSSLMMALSLSLLLFVGIALLGVSLILAMLAYSCFLSKKKESAILLALGAKPSSIGAIFRRESVLVSLLSAALSLLLSAGLERIANRLVEAKFGFQNLIRIPYFSYGGVPLAVPLALLAFASFLSAASSSLPFFAIRRIPLAEALHDE